MKLTKRQARNSRPLGVFITATDTGVGKTLVASALAACLTQRGIDVGVMKPVETGVSRSRRLQSDGARLKNAAGSCDPIAEICPYVFRLPVAPLSAARVEGKTIRMATIMRTFEHLRRKHARMIVEGAGGLYTPVTQSLNMLDLIYQMKLQTLVVGESSLGGINLALLTIHALRQRKIPVVALVLNQCRPARTKNARLQEQSTVNLLRRLAGVPVVDPLPYSQNMKKNWDEGLIRLAGTAPIKKLVKLILASGQERHSQPDRYPGPSELQR